VFLGDPSTRGARSLDSLPAESVLRQRCNAFYPHLHARVLDWLWADGGK